MITLIIKGDMVAASLALSRRAIKAKSVTAHPFFRECTVVIEDDVASWQALTMWFHEPGQMQPAEGYADGTLLWFGPRDAP